MIEQKIRQIIKENIEISIPLQDFWMDFEFIDIGINSITFIKIIIDIENEFNIEFSDEDLDYNKFSNLGSLVLYVQNKVS